MHVQFADADESVIISCFYCQQDPIYYEFLGEVEVNDPRYIRFYESIPEMGKMGIEPPVYP